MITAEMCIALLLDRFPGFAPTWEEHRVWVGSEEPGRCNDMAAFSHYAYNLIEDGPRTDLPAIFAVIETFMVYGDEEAQTITATCFLENLQNRGAPPEHWVHLLGPASRTYCRAWDEFTGVRTAGL